MEKGFRRSIETHLGIEALCPRLVAASAHFDRRELALLRAVGYNRTQFMTITLAECAVLVAGGLRIGTVGALVAIAPALLARGVASSGAAASGLVLVAAVLVAGLVVAVIASAISWRSPLVAALRSE